MNGTNMTFPMNWTSPKPNQTHHHHHSYHYFGMDENSCETLECIMVKRYRHDNYNELFNMSLMLGFISFIGAIGNIIVIMVFIRNRIKKSSTYFMLTLAIIDFMVCTIVIPGIVAREWMMKYYYDVLCKVIEFMRSLMIPVSALILIAIAFDRFFLICMSTKEIMTPFVTKMVILVIMLLGMGLGVPPLLFISVYVPEDDGTYYNWEYCVKTEQFIGINGQYHYWYFVTTLFGTMIVIIFILYLLILKKVIQRSRMWINRRPKIFPERRNTAGTLHGKIHIESTMSNHRTSVTKILHISTISSISEQSENQPSTSGINSNQPPTSGINNNQPATSGANSKNIQPLPSETSTKTLTTRNSKQQMDTKSCSPNIKTLSDIRKRSVHVKTTQVLFIVTLVYIFSFLPTFLETNEVLESNKYLTYIYFVNNAANPIIYSFMNARFREEARRLYCKCMKT